MTTTSRLQRNFAEVHERIAQACERAARPCDDVTLVAVSKEIDAATVNDALHLPATLAPKVFGENRVQELIRKTEACPEAVFHLIGTLQRNKVARVVGAVPLIHSIDSMRLLAAIDAAACAQGIVQDVLLQVNVSGEQSKHGFAPDQVSEALGAASTMDGVHVRGFMTMAPLGEPEAARPFFHRLAHLAHAHALPELSMGMSGDFEVAIEEGATLVRIGSALFADGEAYETSRSVH